MSNSAARRVIIAYTPWSPPSVIACHKLKEGRSGLPAPQGAAEAPPFEDHDAVTPLGGGHAAPSCTWLPSAPRAVSFTIWSWRSARRGFAGLPPAAAEASVGTPGWTGRLRRAIARATARSASARIISSTLVGDDMVGAAMRDAEYFASEITLPRLDQHARRARKARKRRAIGVHRGFQTRAACGVGPRLRRHLLLRRRFERSEVRRDLGRYAAQSAHVDGALDSDSKSRGVSDMANPRLRLYRPLTRQPL